MYNVINCIKRFFIGIVHLFYSMSLGKQTILSVIEMFCHFFHILENVNISYSTTCFGRGVIFTIGVILRTKLIEVTEILLLNNCFSFFM